MAARKAKAKVKARPRGWTKLARATFLATLAETSNVTASARAADMPVSSVYALRRKSAEFRLEWSEALAEGYARLEASLLQTALGQADKPGDADELKREAARYRLALGLLHHHRPAVKGLMPVASAASTAELKARILDRVALMRQRIEAARADDEAHG